MDTKLFVATKYLKHNERLGGSRPVLTKVAAECRVGRDFVAKIERELIENNRVLVPEETAEAASIGAEAGATAGAEEIAIK